jgi:hypothetical protein
MVSCMIQSCVVTFLYPASSLFRISCDWPIFVNVGLIRVILVEDLSFHRRKESCSSVYSYVTAMEGKGKGQGVPGIH